MAETTEQKAEREAAEAKAAADKKAADAQAAADKAAEAARAAGKKPTKPFRLKAAAEGSSVEYGNHFMDGKLVQPGQVVQLTETQAVAFKDKFDPA